MLRSVKTSDINWKNTPLLCKFLNEGGKILNRKQTRLPGRKQKKLSRAVKQARNIGILPHFEEIKEYDKIPLTSLKSSFMDNIKRYVDPNTGLIKTYNKPSFTDEFSYQSYVSPTEVKQKIMEKL